MFGLKTWVSFEMKLEDILNKVNTSFEFRLEAEK